MSAYTEAMVSLAEMLPQEGDDPRLRAIANEVGRISARLALAERVVEAARAVEDKIVVYGPPHEHSAWHRALRARLAEWEGK